MKIEGRITILINRDYTSIEIEDDNANVRFVRIQLTPEQLSAILSKQAYVPCELDVSGLDKVGKKHENKSFSFEVPKDMDSSRHSDALTKMAQSYLTNRAKDGLLTITLHRKTPLVDRVVL
jgi:hypothetical protein